VAFSPDGKRLASSSNEQTVKLWDTHSGQETLTLKGQGGQRAGGVVLHGRKTSRCKRQYGRDLDVSRPGAPRRNTVMIRMPDPGPETKQHRRGNHATQTATQARASLPAKPPLRPQKRCRSETQQLSLSEVRLRIRSKTRIVGPRWLERPDLPYPQR
jgi:hypothetical protein